jgi:hypothetical protein
MALRTPRPRGVTGELRNLSSDKPVCLGYLLLTKTRKHLSSRVPKTGELRNEYGKHSHPFVNTSAVEDVKIWVQGMESGGSVPWVT